MAEIHDLHDMQIRGIIASYQSVQELVILFVAIPECLGAGPAGKAVYVDLAGRVVKSEARGEKRVG